MSQDFNRVLLTDKIKDSLSTLLGRDETALTLSAGNSEPQTIEAGMEGRLCLRTDLKVIKVLTSIDPVIWEDAIDFSSESADKNWVEENFQPVNDNLTALSNVVVESGDIPYFTSNKTMSTFKYTDFSVNLLSAENEEEVRSTLGLKKLATVDSINDDNVDELIADHAITVDKLDYNPITAEQGFQTGDIKETYNSSEEEGWIIISADGTSIGSSDSGAQFKGDSYINLYTKIWANAGVKALSSAGAEVSKGTSANSDWSSNRRLVLPTGFSYINPNVTYKIKV